MFEYPPIALLISFTHGAFSWTLLQSKVLNEGFGTPYAHRNICQSGAFAQLVRTKVLLIDLVFVTVFVALIFLN